MTGKSIRILTVTLAFLGVLFVLQPAALADPATVSMTLTEPQSGSVNADGIYLSPYAATINGVPNQPVICDDFFDNSYMSEQWTATVYNESTGFSGTRMAQVSGLTGTPLNTDYEEIGWLALQLYSPANSSYQAAISFAIWDIFGSNAPVAGTGTADSETVANWVGAGSSFFSDSNATDKNTVMGWVNLAEANASSYDLSILTVYSPVSGSASCGGGNCSTTPPQEFVSVQTPETSSLANLAVDLLLLAGAVFVIRRRRLTSGLSN